MRNSREDELIYRRGLIMGLTMAEVMVLVLFALLLLIGFQAKKILDNQRAKEQLLEIGKALGAEPNEITDDFAHLVAAAELTKELSRSVQLDRTNALQEAKDLIEIGRYVRDQFGKNTVGQTGTQAAKNFVSTAAKAFGQQGKRFGSSGMWISDAANAQQKDSGNGRVLPPCALSRDGKPAYVFTATLFNENILVEDRDLAPAQELDVWPLFEHVTREERLASATFLEQTRAIFEWSQARNCRFFVWIDDGTGVSEKRRYKERLRTVGQHFYYFEPNESVEGKSAPAQ